jgi:hypothetical protein
VRGTRQRNAPPGAFSNHKEAGKEPLMKGIPTFRLNRLKQAAVMAAAVAVVAGASVLGGTGVAHAAVPISDLGNGQGTMGVSVGGTALTEGGAAQSTSSTPTWSSPACPSTNNGSAKLLVVDPLNPTASTALLAPINNSVTAAFTFTSPAADELSNVLPNLFDNVNGDTVEVVVQCYASASGIGASVYENDAFLSISADGSTFQLVAPPAAPPATVNFTLTSNPATATSGQSVTLTATASVTTATGSVQFENNGAAINTPAILAGGVASTMFTAPTVTTATTDTITAVYTPTGNFAAGTVTPYSLTVNPAPVNPTTASGSIPLAVNVPLSGTFSLTVNTSTWVVLGVNSAGTVATGATTPIVVTDTYNSYPGWSVTGQATQWTGVTNPAAETPSGYPAATDIPADHGAQTMAADQLGWAPTSTGTLPTGVTVNTAGIAAGTTGGAGLGDGAQVLATGKPGVGSYTGAGGVTLGANLTLDIPSGQEEGPYAAFLNIDATSGTP